jgi:hypothetical protein
MTDSADTRPEPAPYQRLAVADIERQIQKIRHAALQEEDYETAHSLEDDLFLQVVQKLAHRGSLIAKAALESKKIKFPRRCT